MPTVAIIGPYRFYFLPATAMSRRMSMLSANPPKPNSGSFQWIGLKTKAFPWLNCEKFNVLLKITKLIFMRSGTNFSLTESEALATTVTVSKARLEVALSDGRTVGAPLAWYPRLKEGKPSERRKYRLIGGGIGIHWPDLDEDISVEGLLGGRRSGESTQSLAAWRKKRAR
jgi:hypothetical protein